eukprot:CAMPEP_0194575992 /NCGR_PEP_ID=MMETSP0292-20121207/11265_1 /TAXON_ID=39354 /ORGANISM="Heterosigma akashiwo, Strain CCMP2393" /LENGTH=228 /DNA_ID=CAMNT_0039427911 /DNA_START=132 /DNA_END=818 /DNA_ORIENTATION=-
MIVNTSSSKPKLVVFSGEKTDVADTSHFGNHQNFLRVVSPLRHENPANQRRGQVNPNAPSNVKLWSADPTFSGTTGKNRAQADSSNLSPPSQQVANAANKKTPPGSPVKPSHQIHSISSQEQDRRNAYGRLYRHTSDAQSSNKSSNNSLGSRGSLLGQSRAQGPPDHPRVGWGARTAVHLKAQRRTRLQNLMDGSRSEDELSTTFLAPYKELKALACEDGSQILEIYR